MALRPGTRLGPYEVVAAIGSGGMGDVYKARDTRLARIVAVKVLSEQVARDPDLKQRFEREARAVAALEHPHICVLHDIGQQDGLDFLVMEYLEGETLAQRLTKSPLPLDQALQYATQIADALAAAHRQGIVHRDLKPGNIMLTKSGARVTTPGRSPQESHRWPDFLPDGRHFIYLARRPDTPNAIFVGLLDSKETRYLLSADSNAMYSPPGFLLFVRGTVLMAQTIDVGRLELAGDPFPVAQDVPVNIANGRAPFSASDDGILVYRSGGTTAQMQLGWYDRSGKALSSVGPVGDYRGIALSPDGQRIAMHRHVDSVLGLWILEPARDAMSRFTFEARHDTSPVWSPDGARIAFAAEGRGIYLKSSSGAAAEEPRLEPDRPMWPTDWSPDGRFIVYTVEGPKTRRDLWMLALDGDRKPTPLLQTPFNEERGQLSSDGRWLAYSSDDSGRSEVFVQPFPPSGGGKWQVSTAGGGLPRWRGDGKEIFYVAPDGRLMAAVVSATGVAFQVSPPQVLFETRFDMSAAMATGYPYDVPADGERFLLAADIGEARTSPLTVVVNWMAGLRR